MTLKKAKETALAEELAVKQVVDIQSETTPTALIRSMLKTRTELKIQTIVTQIQSVAVAGRSMKLRPVDSKMLSDLNVGGEGI